MRSRARAFTGERMLSKIINAARALLSRLRRDGVWKGRSTTRTRDSAKDPGITDSEPPTGETDPPTAIPQGESPGQEDPVGAILKCPVLGWPPGRPCRCGRSFRRGRFMPEGNLAGRRAEAPPCSFLQQRPSNRLRPNLPVFYNTNRSPTAGLGRATRTRPRQAQPRGRRNGARRLLAAGGLGPSLLGTVAGMLLRCLERADI